MDQQTWKIGYRAQLIQLVHQLSTGGWGSDEKNEEMARLLEENVPHPEVLDLIFYPEREMTAEEIVDEVFAYQKRIIALPPLNERQQ